ncbi:DUF2630 family protein [Arthrobacter sp. ov407]|uniref:DUF2630 family protein n=1 Tax=Arthrobacter sp. ov407 TaxID=1761748 RepID=UPI000B885DFB|nr:DUF2630 family protein [Arthrobacter sp. ov407]
MDNQDILERIKALVEEEHGLREGSQAAGAGAGAGAPDILRLQQVEEQLDQCWDLLRQRRAKKDYGENPDEAEVRPVSEVEGYQS